MGLFPDAVAAKLPDSLSFTGQTVLITGANTGLGLAAAIHYVQLDAKTVIITSRNAARGDEAKETIESLTGKKGVVQVRILDMSSFAGVKAFCQRLKEEVTAIDIVLLNAGCIEFTHKLSPDGWESDLQINTLSTTLLAILLLPWMRSVRQRVQHLTIVGSRAHLKPDVTSESWPKQDVLKYWNDAKNYQPGPGSYAVSKLLVQYAVLEIAKLAIDGDGVADPIVNTVCPGSVKTDLSRNFTSRGFLFQAIVGVYTLRSLTPEEGSRIYVVATTTSPAENGKFITSDIKDSDYAKSACKSITNKAGQEMQALVWKEILQVLERDAPEIRSILGNRNK